MPCRVENWEYVSENTYQDKIDKLETLLCAACTVLENEGNGLFHKVDSVCRKPLTIWWNTHKKEDELQERKRQSQAKIEFLKRNALDKLTLEEKELLGLK